MDNCGRKKHLVHEIAHRLTTLVPAIAPQITIRSPLILIFKGSVRLSGTILRVHGGVVQGEGLKIALRASQGFSPVRYLFPCDAIRSRCYGISFDNLRRTANFLCYNISRGGDGSRGWCGPQTRSGEDSAP